MVIHPVFRDAVFERPAWLGERLERCESDFLVCLFYSPGIIIDLLVGGSCMGQRPHTCTCIK